MTQEVGRSFLKACSMLEDKNNAARGVKRPSGKHAYPKARAWLAWRDEPIQHYP
jgi:hypothetical protein